WLPGAFATEPERTKQRAEKVPATLGLLNVRYRCLPALGIQLASNQFGAQSFAGLLSVGMIARRLPLFGRRLGMLHPIAVPVKRFRGRHNEPRTQENCGCGGAPHRFRLPRPCRPSRRSESGV